MSDYNLFRQVRELLEENTTTPEFIYTTSVQNHSPYVMLSDSDRKIVTSDQLSDEGAGEYQCLRQRHRRHRQGLRGAAGLY